MIDILGKALLDYHHGNYTEDIITRSTITEADSLPLPYLFRKYADMPLIEQKAMQLATGKTLDVGCGAGSHSLYLQNVKNISITAIDVSKGATEVAKLRGVNTVVNKNLFEVTDKYDTILLLMNGVGISGKLERINLFLQHLKDLLNLGGQILLDSSDISYMFDADDDGGFWVNPEAYYGEVCFTMQYKKETSEEFDWLYLDFNTLQNACHANGLSCNLVQEGEHFDFLARLTVMN